MSGKVLLFTPMDPNVTYKPPKRHYGGDCGYDLTVAKGAVIAPRSFAQISTNIRVALPVGTWDMVMGRSSSFYKRGLVIDPGIIDGGWRGELFGMAYNLTDQSVVVKPGERVAQFIIFSLITPECREVGPDDFPTGERGENGFGSTGGIS